MAAEAQRIPPVRQRLNVGLHPPAAPPLVFSAQAERAQLRDAVVGTYARLTLSRCLLLNLFANLFRVLAEPSHGVTSREEHDAEDSCSQGEQDGFVYFHKKEGVTGFGRYHSGDSVGMGS